MNVRSIQRHQQPRRSGGLPDRQDRDRKHRRGESGRGVSDATPAIVLGGTGYVAGELLRLIAGHPRLSLAGILSDSQPGAPVAAAFPHCEAHTPRSISATSTPSNLSSENHPDPRSFRRRPTELPPQSSIGFSAPPRRRAHARTASTSRPTFDTPPQAPMRRCTSTRMALRTGSVISPARCPEHLPTSPTPHVSHPGCFATAVLLASVPLLALGLTDTRLFVTGITGSTGSGRRPGEGTHHPQRHSDLYSYGALSHRHVPEITACAKLATGIEAEFNFVPHSGPFAPRHPRHRASQPQAADRQRPGPGGADRLLQDCPFVRVIGTAPRVKDVATSNYANLSAVTNGTSIAVMSVLDNLNKGAAGGGVQWMNRLLGFDESLGLKSPRFRVGRDPCWTTLKAAIDEEPSRTGIRRSIR